MSRSTYQKKKNIVDILTIPKKPAIQYLTKIKH